MLEVLESLIKLQHIDNQLMELEADKGDLPEQLDRLKERRSHHKSSISDIELKLAEISKQKTETNRSIEEARERLKRSQSVIYSVKTTREYDAISSEIEQAKRQIAEGERQLIEQIAREEELEALGEDERAELAKIDSEYAERQDEMEEQLSSSREEEAQLVREREEIIAKLPKPVYKHYDRIRKLRDGIGVSYIVDNACNYCYSRIPPQRQAEIRTMDSLILCEVCGCILVSEEAVNLNRMR